MQTDEQAGMEQGGHEQPGEPAGGTRRPPTKVAVIVAGVAIALAFGWQAWQWKRTADALPYIHDISTDTDQPPVFRTLAFARANAPNGVDYGGAAVAAEQKKAYPDIAPLTLAAPPEQARVVAVIVSRRPVDEPTQGAPACRRGGALADAERRVRGDVDVGQYRGQARVGGGEILFDERDSAAADGVTSAGFAFLLAFRTFTFGCRQ